MIPSGAARDVLVDVIKAMVKNPDELSDLARTAGKQMENEEILEVLVKNPEALEAVLKSGPDAVEELVSKGDEALDLIDDLDVDGVKSLLDSGDVVDINIRPTVSNEKLNNIIKDLYKGQGGPNTIGNGTTMDAVRNAIITGNPTNGRFHTQKLEEYVTALQKRLRAGDLDEYDQAVVKSLIEDATNALLGK